MFMLWDGVRAVYFVFAFFAGVAVIAVSLQVFTPYYWASLLQWICAPILLALGLTINHYWGGQIALDLALTPFFCLTLIYVGTFFTRSSATLTMNRVVSGVVAVAMAGVLAVGAGSYYAAERLGQSQADLHTRSVHWQQSLQLLQDSPLLWLIGIGSGQYFNQRLLSADADNLPGQSVWRQEGEQQWVTLRPSKVNKIPEPIRLSQHLAIAANTEYRVRAVMRSSAGAQVHFGVCEKWLLYLFNCAEKSVSVPLAQAPEGSRMQWQTVELVLPKTSAHIKEWHMTQFQVFAWNGTVDIAQIQLSLASQTGSLLKNEQFAQGLNHWFTTSDRHHLPWHAKNIGLHILIEYGVIGLLLASLLLLSTLWRLLQRQQLPHFRSHTSTHGQIFYTAVVHAAILFVLVGVFDTLLDAPRLATLFLLLLMLARLETRRG
jgi:hypothetical protein